MALCALTLVTLFAFTQLFTTFVIWDDEGYFLQAFHDMLSGHALYDQVVSFYGPLTFFLAAAAARFNVANVTHDYFRWVTLPVWIAIAALMAGVVWRLTRRFNITLIAFLVIGYRLQGLAKGIGHPQLWILLGVSLLLILGTEHLFSPSAKARAFWIGVLIGCIVLLKINIGILIAVGYLMAASFGMKGTSGKLLNGMAGLVAVLPGGALLLANTTSAEKLFVFTWLVSIVLIVTLARIVITRSDLPVPLPANLSSMALGLSLCVCAGLCATLATGTTPGGLWNAYVTAPAMLARSLHFPFLEPMQRSSLLISAAAFTAVILGLWVVALAQPVWLGLLKLGVGAGFLSAFFNHQRPTLTGSLLFLGLVVMEVPVRPSSAFFNRLLLCVLSIFFSLQIYPMAGEQVDWAVLMPIIAAAVLLADGVNLLAREDPPVGWPRTSGIATVILSGVLILGFALPLGTAALSGWRLWQSEQSLDLPGAHWLRLPAKDKSELTSTVRELRQNCDAVLLVPGLYSLSLWSGVPPAETKRLNVWPFLWPNDVRRNEYQSVLRRKDACVLVSPNAYSFLRRLTVSPGKDEIVTEIQVAMKPTFRTPRFTLYRP